jgi:hypothetical protein
MPSVSQTARQWKRSQLSSLQVDVVVTAGTRQMSVQAFNRGGGIALRTVLFLVEGTEVYIASPPGHGALRPGQMAQAQSDFVVGAAGSGVYWLLGGPPPPCWAAAAFAAANSCAARCTMRDTSADRPPPMRPTATEK